MSTHGYGPEFRRWQQRRAMKMALAVGVAIAIVGMVVWGLVEAGVL